MERKRPYTSFCFAALQYYRFFVYLILFLLPLAAKSQKYSFRSFTVADGLPQSYVYSLSQGELGYMWIGTGEGLSRFDGKNFTNYSTNSGLAENFINAGFIDSKNRKWFGHYQGGISLFDNDRFIIVRKEDENSSRINCIEEDAAHQVFVGTQNNGILQIDLDLKVSALPTLLDHDIIWSIHATKDGLLWVGANSGLYAFKYDNNSLKMVFQVDGLSEYPVKSILTIDNKTLLVGTEEDGIYYVTYGKTQANVLRIKEGVKPSGYKLNFLTKDRSGHLWVSRSELGISRCVLLRDTLVRLEEFNRNTGLNSNFVKSFFVDKEGNCWFGTFDGLYELTNQVFTNYAITTINPGLNNINSVVNAPGNELWAGTNGGLLTVKISTNFFAVDISSLEKKFPLLKEPIHSLVFDKRGNAYFAISNLGVFMLDKKRSHLTQWFYHRSDQLSNKINHLTIDKGGNIWLATGAGAYRYSPSNRKFRHYDMADGLVHNHVYSVFVDSKNIIWFATHGSGVSRFINDHFQTIQSPTTSLGIDINCFSEDKQGNIWLGTYGQGVFKFSDDKLILNINKKDGLGSNFCYLMTTDYKGNLWVGHKNGFSKINLPNNAVSFFNNNEFVQGAEVNTNAVSVDNNHFIWFGSNKGLIRYQPQKDVLNTVEPKLHVTKVQLFYKDPDWEKLHFRNSELEPPKNLKLEYDNNHITIHYIGICFSDPQKVRYRYILEGFDKRWSIITYETFATYSNLPPGTYRFVVKAQNNDGIWNKIPATYTFTILPPYWQTWWFYTINIASVLSLVYVIFRWRTSNLKRQKQVLEEEKIKLENEIRERRLAEKKLQESEEQLQISNNELNTLIWRSYHDLRGPLSTVTGLVNVANLDPNKERMGQYFNLIADSVHKLEDILKGFFRVSKIKQEAMKIEAIDLKALLDEELNAIGERIDLTAYQIKTKISVSTEPFYNDKTLVGMLMHNILHNAFVYTFNNPKIDITIKQYKSNLKIVVADNGIGIHRDALGHVFDMFFRGTEHSKGNGLGLYLVRNIIDKLGGKIDLFSEEGKGTSVFVLIPGVKIQKSTVSEPVKTSAIATKELT